MNEARRVARNTAANLAGQILSKLLLFGVLILAARGLGEEGFGYFSVALTLAGLAALAAEFGIGTVTARDVARDRSLLADYARDGAGARLALAAAAYALLLAAGGLGLLPEGTRFGVQCFGLSVFPLAIYRTGDSLLWGVERMGATNGLLALQSALLLAGAAWGLLIADAGPDRAPEFAAASVVLGMLLGHLVAAAASFGVTARLAHAPLPRFRMGRIRPLLAASAPLALLSLLGVLYLRIDVVMLAYLRGPRDVGLYSASSRLLEALLFVPAGVTGAAFPLLARRVREGGGEASRPVAVLLIRALFTVGAFLAAVLWAWPDRVLGLLYGGQYAPSAQALRLLAPAVPLIYVNAVLLYELVAAGHQGACARGQAVTTAANVVLNLLLIPILSYVGAALATLVSEGLTTAVFWGLNRRRLRPLRVLPSLAAPAVAAGLLAAALRLLDPVSPVLAAGAGLLSWVGALVLLKAFGPDDRALARRILDRGAGAG